MSLSNRVKPSAAPLVTMSSSAEGLSRIEASQTTHAEAKHKAVSTPSSLSVRTDAQETAFIDRTAACLMAPDLKNLTAAQVERSIAAGQVLYRLEDMMTDYRKPVDHKSPFNKKTWVIL